MLNGLTSADFEYLMGLIEQDEKNSWRNRVALLPSAHKSLKERLMVDWEARSMEEWMRELSKTG